MARAIAGALSLDGAPISESFVRRLATPPAGALAYDVSAWSGDGAQLAQATFREPSGRTEPLGVARDGDSGCALVLAGHIDNADQLLAALGSSDALRLAERYGQAGCALAAYLRWGRTSAARLLGEFALALWSPRTRNLLLACDHVASRPLYYAASRGRFLFASTAAQLFRDEAVAREVDAAAAVTFLYGLDREFRTFHQGVDAVPAAHTLEAGQRGIELFRHWEWPSRPPARRVASGAEPEEFRAILAEAVRCRLRREGQAAIPLSGGLDSSSVASTAGHLAAAGDVSRPRVYSWIWANAPSVDERTYSRAVAERHGLEHVLIPSDDAWPYSELERWLPYLTDPYLPPHDGLWRRMLERARADGASTVVLTIGADELTSGSSEYLADWLVRGHWLRLVRELGAGVRKGNTRASVGGLVLPLLPARAQRPSVRRRARDLRALMPPEIARRYGAEILGPAHSGPSGWWYELRRSASWPGLGRFLAYHDRLALLYGLEFTHPYLDRRLVEFVLRSAPDVFYGAGATKSAARKGLADLLPTSVRERVDKPNPYPWFQRAYRERLAGYARRLAVESELERRGLVEGEPLRLVFERYLWGEDAFFPQFWYGFVVETWLRHEAGRLEVPA